jgi:hypothetical protein
VSISDCRFSHTRHAVTTGGSSGTNQNGVQRNLVIANCTSMLADTGHFDTHQPAENVTFIGCVADGGIPAISTSGVNGFQMRARNCSIVGCSVLQAVGRGIMIFGPVSSGAVITGNMVANVQATAGNQAGTGIYFDSAGTSNHTVTGNVIKNCDGAAIANGGSNSDFVISGNIIANVASAVTAAAVDLTNATRVQVIGNNISAIGQSPAVAMRGSSDDWQVTANHFVDGGGVLLAGTGSVLASNFGYNPVGAIASPWPSGGTDLTNRVTAGNAAPLSGARYTVRHTSKTIVISGGDVAGIQIDGAETGLTAGVFKLAVGETIAISYGSAPPATLVFAE